MPIYRLGRKVLKVNKSDKLAKSFNESRRRKSGQLDNNKKTIYSNKDLTVKNYKEPLREVEGGYGYLGTVSQTVDGELIQCHICGKLFRKLGPHIYNSHNNMKAVEYKDKFKLSKKTPLMSDNAKHDAKIAYLARLKTMSKEEKEHFILKNRNRAKSLSKKNIRKRIEKHGHVYQPKESLEAKNKKGTCPDQLLNRIKQCAEKLKKTPSKKEFIEHEGTQKYMHCIYRTFGSWLNAVKLAKLKPAESTQSAGNKNTDLNRKYSEEYLIEIMRIFTEENQRIPTYTDFNNGLLPDYACYTRRWGSIRMARSAAKLYQIVDYQEIKNTLEV